MTFEQLFKKMQESINNGADYIAQYYLDEFKGLKEGIRKYEDYNFIKGFLWGIYGAGFISNDEKKDLLDKLNNRDFN